jgi:Fe-S cluster biosynthesis and repair protein YggX
MGLPLRITFNDTDYIYQIVNSKLINQNTTELELLINEEKVLLIKDDKRTWIQKDGSQSIDPELAEALGRSISLRLRM